MRLYRTTSGHFVECEGQHFKVDGSSWDVLLAREDLPEFLATCIAEGATSHEFCGTDILAPIDHQEVWAAGVTYYRSRGARMEESKDAGGGTFYDRVYSAERPELFFKSTASRTVGTGGKVRIRGDAHWSVPEPELTLVVSPVGRIHGYTIGNDMSSRDIEGENPLYLPQAKVYHRSCALGPGILLTESALARTTQIELEILRAKKTVFRGVTTLAQLKRTPAKLVEFLFRENAFPHGCFLLTGTGIVPPDSFTLAPRDEVRISIAGIGTLSNIVEQLSPTARP